MGTRSRAIWRIFRFACILAMPGLDATAAGITNAWVVNVTPSSFDVFCRANEPVTPSVQVFADTGGLTNLRGVVGVEAWPLHTGDPAASNAYARRAGMAATRQGLHDRALVLLRVDDCLPDTPYYFRIEGDPDGGGGTAVWPTNGSLALARTAACNSFVGESRQVLLDIPADAFTGGPHPAVGLLSHADAGWPLAAVSGDGIAQDRLYFDLSRFFSVPPAATNLSFAGAQTFSVDVYGPPADAPMGRDLDLTFGTTAVVARASQYLLAAMYVIETLAGEHGSITPTNPMVAHGDSVALTIGADAYYLIGDALTNGLSVSAGQGTAGSVYVWSNVVADGTFEALFTPQLAIHGVPVWWLALHDLTNDTWDVEALRDGDEDGAPAWKEWFARTDPTEGSSCFRLSAVGMADGGTPNRVVIRWASVDGREYAVARATDLVAADFVAIASNIAATPPMNVYTDSPPAGTTLGFYRITVGDP